ncbi:MAG: DUF721 domain-containing protein [Planctomycetaceae bacterium]|jgi:predicted nucleic acid-binding Zn ribbon protein|nr:DUF721 domain-containing protein [Planctomycetaceae bacterium]
MTHYGENSYRTHWKGKLSRLGDVLPSLIVRYGLQNKRNTEHLTASWSEAVGEPFSNVSRVSALKRGVLEITVSHNAFIQELLFRQKELLAAMQESNPDEKIRKIKFITG